MTDDRYLWDGTGPVDPEVARLEAALRPLGADAPAPRTPRRFRVAGAVAAVAAVVLAAIILWRDGRPDDGVGAGMEFRVADGGTLVVDEWFTAPRDGTRIELDDYADLTLSAGSRLQLRGLDREAADLYLDRGRLDAFVYPTARPRFFQVGTPAARCVDLGCEYTLEVGDDGDAWVRVSMGQVAFAEEGREVLILSGAECRASRARGAGTPRFVDSPQAFVDAIDRVDAEAEKEARRTAVEGLLELAPTVDERYVALPLWHLMGDPDPAVASRVTGCLEGLFGRPDGLAAGPGHAPMDGDSEVWRLHLGLGW